jgi:hypothetical protein
VTCVCPEAFPVWLHLSAISNATQPCQCRKCAQFKQSGMGIYFTDETPINVDYFAILPLARK